MKTISLFALSMLLLLVFVSCNKDDDQTLPLYETVELEYRETKTVDGTNFSITFENLIEDSRCPEDANCIWSGRVVVEIKVQENEAIAMYQLATNNTLNLDSLTTFQYKNHKVELIKALPYLHTTVQLDPDDYSVELEITTE